MILKPLEKKDLTTIWKMSKYHPQITQTSNRIVIRKMVFSILCNSAESAPARNK